MANLKDISRRIVTVKSTQKITSAMKMVSAAKLRRAQDAIEAARPYAQRMRATLEEVAGVPLDETHPLLAAREDPKVLEVVVITSDRGLAGAFNSNVIKAAESVIREHGVRFKTVGLTLIGKKAGEYFARHRPTQVTSRREVGPKVYYAEAQEIAQGLAARYAEGEVDEVVLVYSEFVSTMTQTPRTSSLLPFKPPSADEGSDASESASGAGGDEALPFEIEPSAEELLGALVPKAVEVEIFRALLENQAGEHAARMTAMESATKNTEDLIETLTLEYNRARQAAITSELVEIVTGAQALD